MRDIDEIKKMGMMSTKALLYMLETTVGAKMVNTDFKYHIDSFSNGQEYITIYCEFTFLLYLPFLFVFLISLFRSDFVILD